MARGAARVETNGPGPEAMDVRELAGRTAQDGRWRQAPGSGARWSRPFAQPCVRRHAPRDAPALHRWRGWSSMALGACRPGSPARHGKARRIGSTQPWCLPPLGVWWPSRTVRRATGTRRVYCTPPRASPRGTPGDGDSRHMQRSSPTECSRRCTARPGSAPTNRSSPSAPRAVVRPAWSPSNGGPPSAWCPRRTGRC